MHVRTLNMVGHCTTHATLVTQTSGGSQISNCSTCLLKSGPTNTNRDNTTWQAHGLMMGYSECGAPEACVGIHFRKVSCGAHLLGERLLSPLPCPLWAAWVPPGWPRVAAESPSIEALLQARAVMAMVLRGLPSTASMDLRQSLAFSSSARGMRRRSSEISF